MGMFSGMFSGAAGFMLGAGLMLSPKTARLRRRALRQADSFKRAMMKR
jgi:hypothetical protein